MRNASPWYRPLGIFTSTWVFFPAINFTFQFSMAFVIKFITLLDILNILRHSLTQVCDTIVYVLLDRYRPIHGLFQILY